MLYYLTKKSSLHFSGKLVNCFSSVLFWLTDSENHCCNEEDWYFSIQTVLSIDLFLVFGPSLFCQKTLENKKFPYIFSRDKKETFAWNMLMETKISCKTFAVNVSQKRSCRNLYFWFRSRKHNIEDKNHGSKSSKSQYIMESFISLLSRRRRFDIRIGSETCVI